MKKQFILSMGVGWSGTTSLYYTLQNNLQYMHGGLIKEMHYLINHFNPSDKTLWFNTESLLTKWNYSKFRNGLTSDILDRPLSCFSKSEFNSIIFAKNGLQTYTNYYQKLVEYCGEDYNAVGDFSNSNFRLTEKNLYEIFSLLKINFDVKVVFIFRDFIRRQWSQVSSLNLTNKKSAILKEIIKEESFHRLFSGSNEDIITHENLFFYNYAKKVKDAYKIFGQENVCYLIMEDFFKNIKDNPEVSKLENFLNINIPIDKIYPCCYVPDKGINAVTFDGLSDQSTSDHQPLNSDTYYNLKSLKKISQLYLDFEEFHGYLPSNWGSPIDYGY